MCILKFNCPIDSMQSPQNANLLFLPPPAFLALLHTAFAVDWSSGSPGSRTALLLVDYLNNAQTPGTCGIWKSADGGATWFLKQQADWPTDVTIDPKHPNRVYVSGLRSASNWGISQAGQWGYGGALYSDDAGETWREDSENPFQVSMSSVAVDPLRPCQLWYATAAGGLLHGPAPKDLPGC